MNFKNDIDFLDQHFLIDNEVKLNFIEVANLSKTDIVVEIGPGNGSITRLIAPKVKKLILIELDKRLESILLELKNEFNNIEVIFGNVLDVFIPSCDKIITSLPYSITEPFIEKLLRCDFKETIMITGNTFADSVVNNKINKLCLLTNCFFNTEKILEILPNAFEPKPRVLSAIVKMKKKDKNELLNNCTMSIFREIFFHRKMKIKNSLIEGIIKYKNVSQKMVKELLIKSKIENNILNKNIENCSNEEINKLYEKIKLIR